MSNFDNDRMWGLKEIPLPDPISFLPATSGWLLVAVLALLIMAGLARRRWLSWQRQSYRREALAQLEAIEREPRKLAELPRVIRTAALAAFPRAEVAGLRGVAWLSWLNRNGGRFDPADAESLANLPYDEGTAARLAPKEIDHLLTASRAWVREHHARF
ncbi:MAG: DUF4381 domain-containing protein [Myxococcota bacterium]